MTTAETEKKGDSKLLLPLVEIVSHCYAAELPQYAAMLVYQVSSLVFHKPKLCRARLTVCAWSEDPNLPEVLAWTRYTLSDNGVLFAVHNMAKDEIGRRSIGRNRIALDTEADYVWFADADYLFRSGVLDELVSLRWPAGAAMVYPREVMVSRDHAAGDSLVQAVDIRRPRLVDVDPSQFTQRRYTRAIGGVQIVRGDFAREHGYLAGDERWQSPTSKPFSDFRDDVVYRRQCLRYGKIARVDLPSLFRIRHGRTSYKQRG